MLFSIIAILANILFFVILKLNIYTDTAILPGGQTSIFQRSAFDSLFAADLSFLLYIQIICAAVSVISSVLVIIGVKFWLIRKIRNISTIVSAVLFVIILIVTGFIHPKF